MSGALTAHGQTTFFSVAHYSQTVIPLCNFLCGPLGMYCSRLYTTLYYALLNLHYIMVDKICYG